MQCAELVRREVMGAELLNTGVWHDVCARGLVRTLPISPQDVQPRKLVFCAPRVYRAVSVFRAPSACVGARAHGANVVVLQQSVGSITAAWFLFLPFIGQWLCFARKKH